MQYVATSYSNNYKRKSIAIFIKNMDWQPWGCMEHRQYLIAQKRTNKKRKGKEIHHHIAPSQVNFHFLLVEYQAAKQNTQWVSF